MKPHLLDFGFIILVALYVKGCWLLVTLTGHADHFMPLMYLGTAGQMSVTFLLGYILYRLFRALAILLSPSLRGAIATKQSSVDSGLLRFARNDGLLNLIIADLKAGPLRREILTRALPLFIAFIFFFSTFTSMKFLIADIEPFAWDEYFMTLDRKIHFGYDPWLLLQPFLGYPLITQIIAFFYILWLPVFFLVLYWQLFRFKDDHLRMRFFYTFALTWAINGTFLAIVFSSAGPCYYQNVTGSDHYAPLMEYLRGIGEPYKIWSVATQDLLWRNYTDKSVILGGGISAFPSVHVATTFLFVLMARHINKAALALFFLFFVVILVGSVHLGWHYAVDGYFAIITTWVLWWIIGWLVSRHSRSSQSQPDSHAPASRPH